MRWACILTLVFSCGLAGRIALLYQFGKPRPGVALARLRTLHVAALSYAWSLISGAYAFEVYERIAEPFTVRPFVGFIAGALALWGMVTVTRIVARIGPVFSLRERLIRERGERRDLEDNQEQRRFEEDEARSASTAGRSIREREERSDLEDSQEQRRTDEDESSGTYSMPDRLSREREERSDLADDQEQRRSDEDEG